MLVFAVELNKLSYLRLCIEVALNVKVDLLPKMMMIANSSKFL